MWMLTRNIELPSNDSVNIIKYSMKPIHLAQPQKEILLGQIWALVGPNPLWKLDFPNQNHPHNSSPAPPFTTI
jgi:hypothetical protein